MEEDRDEALGIFPWGGVRKTERHHQFTRLVADIRNAASKVGSPYFQLPVAGAHAPVYRERVYCYELFHQLRTLPSRSEIIVTPEPDKRGHPLVSTNVNPDFLFHRPGTMDRNLAILEVKMSTARGNDQEKDIATLDEFMSKYDYYGGIWLVVGEMDRKELTASFGVRFWRRFHRHQARTCLLWQGAEGRLPCIVPPSQAENSEAYGPPQGR